MSEAGIPQPMSKPTFTTHPSISTYTVPISEYLPAYNASQKFKHSFIATGALVFDSTGTTEKQLRILLIQRAAHDSMPNRWEIPGGACDEEDPSILHGVARELSEETGLTAVRIGSEVGSGHSFLTRSGRLVRKVNFLVECESEGEDGALEVRLDPREHQRYVWATEEDVRVGRVGDVVLRFTTREQEDVVLEGFRSMREETGIEARPLN